MLPEKDEDLSLFHSENEVLDQLNRILSSDLFYKSSVLCSFLKFVVEETIAGRTDGLKEYTIGVNALGKPADFNPQIDAIIRIHAGRLRRLLNEYYSGPGNHDSIKIEIVKGTYVPLFRNQVIIKTEGEVTEQRKSVEFDRTKLTLAVLPFRNLCSKNEFQFFVDGLGEELTRNFSLSQDISVVAHYSTRKYAAQPEDIRVIGAELGAHYMITGSVKRSAGEIRVNVALVETMKGIEVWSHTYTNVLNIDNLMNIQDQIIENIYSCLGGYYGVIIRKSTIAQRRGFSNIASFDASLWNYYYHMNFSLESYLTTRKALEEALAVDPNYAHGLAMLAELHLDAYSLGYPTVEDPVNESYKLVKKAIKIDPECQHAYQELGWTNVYLKRKEDAINALEHCLSLNPSSVSSIGAVGFGMACAGEYKRAHILLTQSIELNPHCPWWFYLGFFLVYYQNKQYEKALEFANKIETKDVFMDPLAKVITKAQLGLTDKSQDDLNKLAEEFPEIMADLGPTLNTFLLDNSLIDDIMAGLNKAKVTVARTF
ncbi:tetratricopeptide repeat protein [Algoriphagus chordae]|uniref:TolB-like protein n=1 Tax=Algoriphagus chordae TaxID=237019 RepID=A0A2W7SXQ3_9BACT|nr:hypothetical protein [Algoriphagus chordae]PZX55582.1 TolB-like protein [Algoriphagus chordae]